MKPVTKPVGWIQTQAWLGTGKNRLSSGKNGLLGDCPAAPSMMYVSKERTLEDAENGDVLYTTLDMMATGQQKLACLGAKMPEEKLGFCSGASRGYLIDLDFNVLGQIGNDHKPVRVSGLSSISTKALYLWIPSEMVRLLGKTGGSV